MLSRVVDQSCVIDEVCLRINRRCFRPVPLLRRSASLDYLVCVNTDLVLSVGSDGYLFLVVYSNGSVFLLAR